MTAQPVVHVVDDDDAVRESLCLLLTLEGLAVQGWPSAQAFLEALPAAPRGCVVTDVHMAGMSGLQLLRQLRAREIAMPVIVITGRSSSALASEAAAAGAAMVIEKPFGPDEIVAVVRGVLPGD